MDSFQKMSTDTMRNTDGGKSIIKIFPPVVIFPPPVIPIGISPIILKLLKK